MKTGLIILGCAALALGGCATYTGGTDEQYGTASGSNGTVIDVNHTDMMGRRPISAATGMVIPIYKQGSPNGQDMDDARPEFKFYW